jgi:hypothetical protein
MHPAYGGKQGNGRTREKSLLKATACSAPVMGRPFYPDFHRTWVDGADRANLITLTTIAVSFCIAQ